MASLLLHSCTSTTGSDQRQAATPASPEAENQRLEAFLDSLFERDLNDSPQWLTGLGRKERQNELNDNS